MDVFGVISSQLNSEPFVYSEPLGFPHKELTPHMQSPPPTRTSKPQRSKVGLAPTKLPLSLAAGSKSSQFAHTDTHNTPLHFNRKTVCPGRCGTVNIHPVLNLINSKAFPGGKLTRIMLTKGFEGERVCSTKTQQA